MESLQWRRNKVLELSSQGRSQPEISTILRVGLGTVSRDIQYLREQAKESLSTHINDRLPEEYQNCMTGLKQVLKFSWDIANKLKNTDYDNGQTMTMTDDKTRILALALANDCYKYIMDLTTNGVVITDAIKFVQTKKEKQAMSTKREENNGKESKEPNYDDIDQLEEKQEEESVGLDEEQTTNQVF